MERTSSQRGRLPTDWLAVARRHDDAQYAEWEGDFERLLHRAQYANSTPLGARGTGTSASASSLTHSRPMATSRVHSEPSSEHCVYYVGAVPVDTSAEQCADRLVVAAVKRLDRQRASLRTVCLTIAQHHVSSIWCSPIAQSVCYCIGVFVFCRFCFFFFCRFCLFWC